MTHPHRRRLSRRRLPGRRPILVGFLTVALLAVATPAANAAPPTPRFGSSIDRYASYDPQSTCSPRPKAGVEDFRDIVLAEYPRTGNFGISRACSVGGTSEHKEGRAWDWKVDAGSQGAIARNLLNWLLATRDGHRHALIRRFGIMYMIWNRRIWSSYRASEGWRPYSGSNPHTDHVHFSFSWAGARRQTTWWTTGLKLEWTAYPTRRRGATGEQVEAIQFLVNLQGQSAGPVDGIFGPLTEGGVRDYQSARSLPVTGVVDSHTWTALLSAGTRPTLRNGSRGGGVRRLQRSLTAALGRTLAIDGIFGPNTEDGVRDYQRSRNLLVDGIVGPQTWGALQRGR